MRVSVRTYERETFYVLRATFAVRRTENDDERRTQHVELSSTTHEERRTSNDNG